MPLLLQIARLQPSRAAVLHCFLSLCRRSFRAAHTSPGGFFRPAGGGLVLVATAVVGRPLGAALF